MKSENLKSSSLWALYKKSLLLLLLDLVVVAARRNEAFPPSTQIYVRQEMIDVFEQLTAERSQNEDVIS